MLPPNKKELSLRQTGLIPSRPLQPLLQAHPSSIAREGSLYRHSRIYHYPHPGNGGIGSSAGGSTSCAGPRGENRGGSIYRYCRSICTGPRQGNWGGGVLYVYCRYMYVCIYIYISRPRAATKREPTYEPISAQPVTPVSVRNTLPCRMHQLVDTRVRVSLLCLLVHHERPSVNPLRSGHLPVDAFDRAYCQELKCRLWC